MDVGAYNHVAPGLAAIHLKSLQVVKRATLARNDGLMFPIVERR